MSWVLAGGARCVRLDAVAGAVSAGLNGAGGNGGGIATTAGVAALEVEDEEAFGSETTIPIAGELEGKTRSSV